MAKNKYPTNIGTNPTLILETDICEAGIPDYSLAYFTNLLDFALKQLKRWKIAACINPLFYLKITVNFLGEYKT